MKIIGTGLGRTGTYSLKLAINELGFGPCHHMEEVIFNMPTQLPLWNDAVKGKADWASIYKAYQSAVDWPTAGFYRELYTAFPQAKFILTYRDPKNWANSFGSTIYTLLTGREQAPPAMHEWLEMVVKVLDKTGFPMTLEQEQLEQRYSAHNLAVQKVIPEEQLLMFQVKDGWQPLCDFLQVPVPTTSFPRTNDREEFWNKVSAAG